ncbi:glycosyltransferase family 2 protein [Arthrobacter sp. B2a2-09]|uniref:glycosyltransferase family 2 protein n=1 Tax=Arthrobacter sp. B2a2-09 TaxID=2952822 RepID=UPI0022CD9E4C|nr:glycosyltransferase [Arthrobacter sp. B2a2-09]MCZ9881425.1 glycosyltransferase [Arthrobacter sp. B2a2-09]
MNAQARVAVVVRTKNRPVLLRRALADIFDQSFEDVAVVVVNDGGDPVPVDALARTWDHLPAGKLTILHHEASKGMEAASNAGIHATASEFISIHDDDDRWHRDFLKKTVGFLDEAPQAQGVAVRTDIVYEEIRGGVIEQTGSQGFERELRAITLSDMLRSNRVVPISFLYRRAVHERIGGYNEALDAVGDWEFNLRFLSAFPIELLDGEPLAFWCQRPSAQGDLGNSVIAGADDHQKFDRYVRDVYLREEAGKTGYGTLLYLAQMHGQQEGAIHELRELAERINSSVDELGRRMASLEETVLNRTSFSDLARRPGRLTGRIVRFLRGNR